MSRTGGAEVKSIMRILRFLVRGEAEAREAASGGKIILETLEHGAISVSRDDLGAAMNRGMVERSRDRRLRLSIKGRTHLEQSSPPIDAFAVQHQEPAPAIISGAKGAEQVTINRSESPLSQLIRRKDRTGRRFLSEDEFCAGERLRADYERARIMPRLGVNWAAPISGARRNGNGAGQELSDTILAARQRVEKALDAVGPELAGVLVDVCCFLKGLERVEAEREWPARSAKVVLKSALAALNRHYRPKIAKRKSGILHWGTQDFRPQLSRTGCS